MGVRLQGRRPSATASARPSGDLVRPDGKKAPANADGLALPPLPTAAEDLWQSVDLRGVTVLDPVASDASASAVITPSGKVAISNVGEVGSVAVERNGIKELSVPAPGFSLWVFTLTVVGGGQKADLHDTTYRFSGYPDIALTYLNGSARTSIATDAVRSFSAGNGLVSYAASIKDGADAHIGVAVAGHEQLLSITTATRADDPVAAVYYTKNRQAVVNSDIARYTGQYKGSTGDDVRTLTYDRIVTTATLSPFDEAQGWAPPGRVWLIVAVGDDASLHNTNASYGDWTVTPAGGAAVAATRNSLGKNVDGLAVFLIAAGTTSVAGHFQTVITLPTGSSPPTLSPPPLDFTASFS
jgi:hypothetical protein